MAGNKVDAIFASEAIAQIIKVKQELALADAELINLSQNASKASASIRGISTPSGLDKTVTDTTQLNAELERQNKIIQGLETQIIKLSQVRGTNNKMSAEEAVNQRILNKNALDQAKATSNLVGEYEKLSLAHQKAMKEAQNVGAVYGTTSTKFVKASEKANILDEKLKTIDSTLGKHNRNVGNYASGWNALGNSVNQLTREMPAFANSAQTGFMAISNNIPAFQDAIMELRKGGMSWGSVLKELGKSAFGLTGIISLVTTLLVVLGPKLWDWATGNDDVRASVDKLNKSYERNDELLKRTSRNIDHQITIAKELAKQQGKSLKEINDLDEKGARQKLKNFELVRDRRKKDYEDFINTEARKNLYWGNPKRFKEDLEKEKQRLRELNSVQKNALIRAENDVKEHGLALSEIIAKNKTSEVEAEKKANKKKEKVRRDERAPKESKEKGIVYQKGTEKWFNQQIDRLKEIQSTTADTTEEYKSFIKQIEVLEKALELLKNGNKFEKPSIDDTSGEAIPSALIPEKDGSAPNEWIKQYVKDAEDAKIKTEQLQQATDNFLKSFSSEVLQNSGLGSLETFFDGTFDKLLEGAQKTEEKIAVTFNAIAESAQEMFNFISNASQANFDAEYARLESQKDVALKFAVDGATSKKKIEEEYDKKRKEIANRENKAKQKQAIFNIAIDTAQAIVATLAKTPPPAGIPLAVALGVLGAAQIGIVAAQKIPQYFDGGVHGGGLAMINDAGGSNYVETVVTPDGKVQQFKGRDVITDLPKGTEIFTPEQWQQKELEYMLNSRGVMLNNQVNKGMTAEQMDMIMAKHFGKIQTNTTVFDKKGIMQWTDSRNSKTIRNANRATGRGFNV